MKDIQGVPLDLYDTVFATRISYNGSLSTLKEAVILRFTPKRVFIQYLEDGFTAYKHPDSVVWVHLAVPTRVFRLSGVVVYVTSTGRYYAMYDNDKTFFGNLADTPLAAIQSLRRKPDED